MPYKKMKKTLALSYGYSDIIFELNWELVK